MNIVIMADICNFFLISLSDDFSLFQPCPISTITRMMAESVAKNFQLLWEYVYDDARFVHLVYNIVTLCFCTKIVFVIHILVVLVFFF